MKLTELHFDLCAVCSNLFVWEACDSITWKDSRIICALVILQLTCDKSRSLLLVAQFLNITCLALAMCHKSMFYSELWCSFELDATSAHPFCFLRNVSPTHARRWPRVIVVWRCVRSPLATPFFAFQYHAFWFHTPHVRLWQRFGYFKHVSE